MKASRLGSAGPQWDELDPDGIGAKTTGGRLNHIDTPMVYASSSIALAVLETVVYTNGRRFSLNRFVVEVDIPDSLFRGRRVVSPPPPDAWDSVPESFKTKDFGSAWVAARRELILDVSSVIISQERNYLLNPLHESRRSVRAKNLGRFVYDAPLLGF